MAYMIGNGTKQDHIMIVGSKESKTITSIGAEVYNVRFTPEGVATLRIDADVFVSKVFNDADARLVKDPWLYEMIRGDIALWGSAGLVSVRLYKEGLTTPVKSDLSGDGLERKLSGTWDSAILTVDATAVPVTAIGQKVNGSAHYLRELLQKHKVW